MYEFNMNLSATVMSNTLESVRIHNDNNGTIDYIDVVNKVLSCYGENIHVKNLPETQEEMLGMLLVVEQYAEILNQGNSIVDIHVSVTDPGTIMENHEEEAYLLTKDCFGEFTKHIPEWAGATSEDVSSFGAYLAEVLENHEDFPNLAYCILNGIKYSIRNGWYY